MVMLQQLLIIGNVTRLTKTTHLLMHSQVNLVLLKDTGQMLTRKFLCNCKIRLELTNTEIVTEHSTVNPNWPVC